MYLFQTTIFAQEVIFGAGSLIRIVEAADRFGWRRMLLCTSPSLRKNNTAGSIESILGDRLAGTFDRVQPHVKEPQVREVVALAAELQADALIGLGGGSAIGIAKAVSFAFEEQEWAAPTTQPRVPVAAIPTTYAGSEMTAVFGVTHTGEVPPRKVTRRDPRIAPKLVIYEPTLTIDLPPAITASTGINALAHCIEALYSITRSPLSTAAAADGARRLLSALPRCYAQSADLAARSEMMIGAHLAGFSLASVKMGLHHGLCHVLGGAAGVPHGIANAILLPHVLRFNARAVAHLLLPVVDALGFPWEEDHQAVEAAAERIAGLICQMDLPQRLRDAGVRENDLPRYAQLAFENSTVRDNPRRIQNAAEIEALLRAAW